MELSFKIGSCGSYTVLFTYILACPEFTDTLAIKQGRHPILDKIAYEPPVPNNAVRETVLLLHLNSFFSFFSMLLVELILSSSLDQIW